LFSPTTMMSSGLITSIAHLGFSAMLSPPATRRIAP
jgi:hypothetical protein